MNYLRPIFSAQKIIQTRTSLQQPAQKAWRNVWVMARALCLYRCWDMQDIPTAERASALKLLIEQWSPFASTRYFVAWQGTAAQVWCWDEARRLAQASELAVSAQSVLPEAVYYARPEGDTLRLCETLDGYEAQYWKDGILLASHWWQQLPDVTQWSLFHRSNSLQPTTSVAQVTAQVLLEQPWQQAMFWRQWLELGYEPVLVNAALVIIVILFSWQFGVLWKLQQLNAEAEAQIATLSAKVGSLLDTRNRAVEQFDRLQALQGLRDAPRQLPLMQQVTQALQDNNLKMLGWRASAGRIEFTLQGEGINASDLVTRFTALQRFTDITTDVRERDNAIVINMQVNPTEVQSAN